MDINKYEIILAKSAKKDIEKIYQYIADNLKEPRIASKLMYKIKKSIFSLERLPYMHAEIHIKPHNKKFRRLIINNYIVLYKIDEDKKIVSIYNVLYGKKDYLN